MQTIQSQKPLTESSLPTNAVQVWLVIELNPLGDRYAVFSDQDKASAWADTCKHPCLLTPYIVDEPEWGDSRSQ